MPAGQILTVAILQDPGLAPRAPTIVGGLHRQPTSVFISGGARWQDLIWSGPIAVDDVKLSGLKPTNQRCLQTTAMLGLQDVIMEKTVHIQGMGRPPISLAGGL